jgi:hypothetical protein
MRGSRLLMRPFRVFNRVTGVRTIWKFAGFRLGGIAQIAMLLVMAASTGVMMLSGFAAAGVIFGSGFIAIAAYSVVLTRIDPDGVMSDLTVLRLLRCGLCHRRCANFDLPGI